MVLPPADTDPQFIEVILVVQPLSENTPMLGDVVMVPDEERFWLTFMAASVDAASAKATTVKTTTKYFEALAIAKDIPPFNKQLCSKS